MVDQSAIPREQVRSFLPQRICEMIDRSPLPLWDGMEEIRLRLGRPLALHGRAGAIFIAANGAAVNPEQAYKPDRSDLERALQLISSSSLYAFEQELRCGYLTVPGGHRVGLCGQAVLEQGVARLKHITGLNTASPEITGAALPYLFTLSITASSG